MKSWVAIAVLMVIMGGMAGASSQQILVSEDPIALAIAAGNYYAKKGDSVSALAWFEKALELDGLSEEAYHNQGVVYYQQGDSDAAKDALRGSIAANSEYAKAHYSLALIFYGEKEYANAIAELRKVVQIEPANANAQFDLGVVLVERFRVKEDAGSVDAKDIEDLRSALEAYQNALSADGDFPHAQSNAQIVESVLNEYLSKQ